MLSEEEIALLVSHLHPSPSPSPSPRRIHNPQSTGSTPPSARNPHQSAWLARLVVAKCLLGRLAPSKQSRSNDDAAAAATEPAWTTADAKGTFEPDPVGLALEAMLQSAAVVVAPSQLLAGTRPDAGLLPSAVRSILRFQVIKGPFLGLEEFATLVVRLGVVAPVLAALGPVGAGNVASVPPSDSVVQAIDKAVNAIEQSARPFTLPVSLHIIRQLLKSAVSTHSDPSIPTTRAENSAPIPPNYKELLHSLTSRLSNVSVVSLPLQSAPRAGLSLLADAQLLQQATHSGPGLEAAVSELATRHIQYSCTESDAYKAELLVSARWAAVQCESIADAAPLTDRPASLASFGNLTSILNRMVGGGHDMTSEIDRQLVLQVIQHPSNALDAVLHCAIQHSGQRPALQWLIELCARFYGQSRDLASGTSVVILAVEKLIARLVESAGQPAAFLSGPQFANLEGLVSSAVSHWVPTRSSSLHDTTDRFVKSLFSPDEALRKLCLPAIGTAIEQQCVTFNTQLALRLAQAIATGLSQTTARGALLLTMDYLPLFELCSQISRLLPLLRQQTFRTAGALVDDPLEVAKSTVQLLLSVPALHPSSHHAMEKWVTLMHSEHAQNTSTPILLAALPHCKLDDQLLCEWAATQLQTGSLVQVDHFIACYRSSTALSAPSTTAAGFASAAPDTLSLKLFTRQMHALARAMTASASCALAVIDSLQVHSVTADAFRQALLVACTQVLSTGSMSEWQLLVGSAMPQLVRRHQFLRVSCEAITSDPALMPFISSIHFLFRVLSLGFQHELWATGKFAMTASIVTVKTLVDQCCALPIHTEDSVIDIIRHCCLIASVWPTEQLQLSAITLVCDALQSVPPVLLVSCAETLERSVFVHLNSHALRSKVTEALNHVLQSTGHPPRPSPAV
ncbi:hypothetical protein CAOG_06355 [Capsaspora owczarzaki ATCC 30864]|uniref:Uncharacterized protein n=1 Tax=Capsaspora owczarzaki (strain ATCC 30864) TaxID=595528 RepID=A0A0D2VWM0_CAPO3|nr:hypothetical protein CAOG_06355 [Capsaspora owczarzaki ATCC 30864]KJE95977.1 hypothetical protein CAOG_006355 [Capsaspora owczarzaki ATCC 30864]|eukprot:XP_004345104.1 hypothetical protein CAOG_06355 [Capsaspora owczarzaki ATCC 30864]